MKFYLLLFLTFCPLLSVAQVSDHIYCLNNPSMGVFNIAKIHLPTGIMTEFDDVADFTSSFYSTSVNIHTEDFYFCDGGSLTVFDTQTEQLEPSIEFGLDASSYYLQVQYNPCDSSLYGIVAQNNFTSFSFERFDLESLEFELISLLPSNYYSCSDCISSIDPANELFVSDNGGVNGLDLSTGEEIFGTSIDTPEGFSFGHISYKCSTEEFFGTLANIDQQNKQLGSVDQQTGQISFLSDSNWEVGFYKPYGGGNAIDQETGIYYYSGAGGNLVGASTVTGQLVYSEDVSSGEIFLIQHFSQCDCSDALSTEDPLEPEFTIDIYPNPFSSMLSVTTDRSENISFILYDLMGKPLSQGRFSRQLELDTRNIAPGAYFCEFVLETGQRARFKVIKE